MGACGADSGDFRRRTVTDNGGGGVFDPPCALDLAYQGFVSTWQVNAGDTVRLPLPRGFNYNFAIDWGDKSEEISDFPYVSSYDDPDVSYTYTRAGEYEVTLYGMVEAWSFANFPDSKDMIVAVDELGDVGWKSLEGAFAGCSNLGAVSGGNTTKVTNMSRMFAGATSLQLDVTSWNFKLVADMDGMFNGVTLTDDAYGRFLQRIVQTTKQNSVPLDAGNSHYSSDAAAAHATLVDAGWEIKDGGPR